MKQLLIFSFLLIFLSGIGSCTLLDGLIAHYKADELSGKLNDTLKLHNFTTSGTPTYGATGKIGYAVNTTNGYFVTSNVDDTYWDLSISKNISVSMWLNASNGTTAEQNILQWQGLDNSHSEFLIARTNYNITLRISTVGGTWQHECYTNNSVSNNNWTHFVLSKNGSLWNIYINGQNKTPCVYSGQINNTITGRLMRIGSYGAGENYKGLIDEIGIWNRTISNSEIATLYNNGNGRAYPFVNYPYYTLEYDSISYAYAYNTFGLTVETNTSQNVYADLIFNGTNYGYTSRSIINGNTTYLTKTFINPSTYGNSTGIKYSFYWNVTTINNRTDIYNQTIYIYNQTIDNCTSTTQVLINFTLYDEKNKNILSTTNISNSVEATLYSASDNTIISITNFTVNKTRFALCTNSGWLSSSLSARLYFVVSYSGDNYFTEFYNAHEVTISNSTVPQTINLYDLDSTDTKNKAYTINVKDASLNIIEGAIVKIYRKYFGAGYILTEAQLTDSQGNAIGHFTQNDVDYIIVIEKSGSTIYNISLRVSETSLCNPTYSDCRLNIQTTKDTIILSNLNEQLEVTYNYTYNKNTRVASLIFISTNNEYKNVSINGTLNNIQECYSSTSNSLSDTVLCNLPEINGTIQFLVKVNDKVLFVNYQKIYGETTTNSDIKTLKLLLLALLFPLIVIMGASSAPISLIFMVIGFILIFSGRFLTGESILGGGSVIVWLIICIVLIAIKLGVLNRSQKNG